MFERATEGYIQGRAVQTEGLNSHEENYLVGREVLIQGSFEEGFANETNFATEADIVRGLRSMNLSVRPGHLEVDCLASQSLGRVTDRKSLVIREVVFAVMVVALFEWMNSPVFAGSLAGFSYGLVYVPTSLLQ